uniref:Uncharacterized protein n=1 Tax=Halorubrum lacusprofundi TaxID=2247 RepID=A0A218KRV7_9EURY|nr:hypothetical protein [Halorubrum lacusprofundi]
MHDQRCEIRSERRTARMANRTEKRARIHVERIAVGRGGVPRHRQSAVVGQTVKCRIPPRPKGRGFLLGQP